jgi:hypothetical protein
LNFDFVFAVSAIDNVTAYGSKTMLGSDPDQREAPPGQRRFGYRPLEGEVEGQITTSDMIAQMPGYVQLSEEHLAANANRKDSRFSQLQTIEHRRLQHRKLAA